MKSGLGFWIWPSVCVCVCVRVCVCGCGWVSGGGWGDGVGARIEVGHFLVLNFLVKINHIKLVYITESLGKCAK